MKKEADILDPTKMFNHETITVDGDLAYARLYTAAFPGTEFIEDARPDYFVKREDFDRILTEVYGNPGTSIFKSYVSSKCFDVRIIEETKTMFFITLVLDEDVVDRNHRYTQKDLEVANELGTIDDLSESLNGTTAEEYNSRSLSPFVLDEELQDVILRVLYYPIDQKEQAERVCELYNDLKFDRDKSKDTTDDAIFTLGRDLKGFHLQKHYLDTTKYKADIIGSNYNDNFVPAYDKITSFLKSDENGLILLTGEPGTGKSSFLMHLTSVCKELKTRFIFIPAVFAEILSDPGFLPFAITALDDSVIILEDAEEVLKDRDAGGSGAVSNILNVTDGILGKLVKVKLIATVNKSQAIDTAIIRKGRLNLKYEFEKLSIDKSNALFTKLEKDITTDKPLTLAEIYNSEDNTVDKVHKEKKIGF